MRAIIAAVWLTATIPVFRLRGRDAFHTWIERIALDPEPWPRQVHLEVVGFPPDSEGNVPTSWRSDDDLECSCHADAENFVVPG